MKKHVIVVVASAVLGAACGLPGLDALESGEADVEIVNADATGSDSSDLGSAAIDDADSEADGSVSDAGKDTAGDGGDNDGESTDADGGQQTTVATGGSIIEDAVGAAISLVGTEDRMTIAPERPTGGWGYLTVDRAFSTAEHQENTATAGSKFVVVDYQILVGEQGNFFEEAFRMFADGEVYSPLNNINEVGSAASVFNDSLVFEVPLAAQILQLEGGVPSGAADGFTTLYDIDLAPAAETEPAEPLTDAEVEAIIGDIQANPATAMTIDTSQPSGGFANLTVDGGRSTAKIDDTSAGPDHKFVIIDFQLLGIERDNFFDHALRLETEGEWYGPIVSFNEILSAGSVFNGSVIFRVPRSATDFVLEGGMPERWDDGLRTTVSFSLWDPAEGVEANEPNDSAGEAAVEAEASSISLIGDEDRMTIDPGSPRGFGRLTIDRAYTTAKIEQDGAKEGFKFLLVEYQLLGIERDNFFDEAFRLEAASELYSPLNNINEIVNAGEVYNGTLVFEVPIGVTMARLESGVVSGATDGYTSNHEIIFG